MPSLTQVASGFSRKSGRWFQPLERPWIRRSDGAGGRIPVPIHGWPCGFVSNCPRGAAGL